MASRNVEETGESSSSTEFSELLKLDDEEGWEDVEPDTENVPFTSLFDAEQFPTLHQMLRHCNETYGFDLLKIKDGLDLDYIGTVKLVNYIRSEVKIGNTSPDVSSQNCFQDQQYLQPVLEDDALLYSLDDLAEDFSILQPTLDLENEIASESPKADYEQPAVTLERAKALENKLKLLQTQFSEHKTAVDRFLENKWGVLGEYELSEDSEESLRIPRVKSNDDRYFQFYDSPYIHETMLKDKVRTLAYRDFIYDHKHLFKDKVVLDVGCGTGILSLFCARAGAQRVIAVDNSNIAYKASAVVAENKLDNIIHVLHGNIEELDIGVSSVDIIVSEWMGYCLLFEGMLESVLWARDRYLKPSGLMVPSHVTLRVAPISDPEYVADQQSFWKDVYGFSMKSILEDSHLYKDVQIRDVKASTLVADSQPTFHANLHNEAIDKNREIATTLKMPITKDIDSVDGFTIWFDTFFTTSADEQIPASALGESWPGAFTTGPNGPSTHWQQGSCLIDRRNDEEARPMKKGTELVVFLECEQTTRELKFEIAWETDEYSNIGSGEWYCR